MCSCRLFRAGMVFCQIQVKCRNCLVTIKLLKGSGKKPWKHARWPAAQATVSRYMKLSRYRKFNKWHNIYSHRLLGLIIKLSGLPRQLHIPAVSSCNLIRIWLIFRIVNLQRHFKLIISRIFFPCYIY
jgi:hypothetical protein